MEVTDRFDKGMDGKVWATIVGSPIEFEAANSEGSGQRKGHTGDEAIFND